MPSRLTLARWLGPWAKTDGVPANVRRTTEHVTAGDGRGFDAWLYVPEHRPITGAYLMSPGLHYDGPEDLRMDRLCRIFAATGIATFAPFIEDYRNLTVSDRAAHDLASSFDAFEHSGVVPANIAPGIFSISFGSTLALRVAGFPEYARRVGGVLTFGGYGHWQDTVRFTISGQLPDGSSLHHDPLNRPVALLNLMPDFAEHVADPDALADGWRRFARATWGQPALKEDGRYQEIARQLAPSVPESVRSLFLRGTGAEPGGVELGLQAVRDSGDRVWFLDPRPDMQHIRCPVRIVHGRDDDVIPFSQAEVIRAALPATVDGRVVLTGLYSHSSQARPGPRTLLREVRALTAVLTAITEMASQRPHS